MKKIDCIICKDKRSELLYSGPIRDGVHGVMTERSHEVVRCLGCGLVRLAENPIYDEYYQSDEYRKTYNTTSSADKYIQIHDKEQLPRLERIGVDAFRDKNVLDYGCGGGSFLDLIAGVAKKTIGIEPFIGYHKSLRERGHDIYSSPEEALSVLSDKVDVVVSFAVIEHVQRADDFLINIKNFLHKSGRVYLETNNLNDILLRMNIPKYPQFFYRTAHCWYFDSTTFERLVSNAGFSDINISFRHSFDLSNMMLWAINGKPTGCGGVDFFDSTINSSWVDFVEKNGLSDMIFIDAGVS